MIRLIEVTSHAEPFGTFSRWKVLESRTITSLKSRPLLLAKSTCPPGSWLNPRSVIMPLKPRWIKTVTPSYQPILCPGGEESEVSSGCKSTSAAVGPAKPVSQMGPPPRPGGSSGVIKDCRLLALGQTAGRGPGVFRAGLPTRPRRSTIIGTPCPLPIGKMAAGEEMELEVVTGVDA